MLAEFINRLAEGFKRETDIKVHRVGDHEQGIFAGGQMIDRVQDQLPQSVGRFYTLSSLVNATAQLLERREETPDDVVVDGVVIAWFGKTSVVVILNDGEDGYRDRALTMRLEYSPQHKVVQEVTDVEISAKQLVSKLRGTGIVTDAVLSKFETVRFTNLQKNAHSSSGSQYDADIVSASGDTADEIEREMQFSFPFWVNLGMHTSTTVQLQVDVNPESGTFRIVDKRGAMKLQMQAVLQEAAQRFEKLTGVPSHVGVGLTRPSLSDE